MLRRLAASRQFAAGDRAGVLRSAQARSGRPFRLDVRQRVIVKARVCRHGMSGRAALAAHLGYLGRPGAGADRGKATLFDRAADEIDASAGTAAWSADRHHFRLVISPEHGDRIADLRRYTREVMRRVGEDLGQPQLEWLATCHFDTDQPHAHVLVRGRRASGKDLVIPRHYIAYGVRARAQEVAHELLGDLSRTEAERRIWRETQADRFTGFDRRLLRAADDERLVDDGVGASGAWAALTRGRLRHLEALGLATRVGSRYRLDSALETRLRALQLGQDMLRLRQQRRLENSREMRDLGEHRVRGRVVSRGVHDELRAVAWVIIRDEQGVEHYARLGFGQTTPRLGRTIELAGTARGAVILQNDRGLSYQSGVELSR
jgi:type IV secretory pathway VirD2 relaxase